MSSSSLSEEFKELEERAKEVDTSVIPPDADWVVEIRELVSTCWVCQENEPEGTDYRCEDCRRYQPEREDGEEDPDPYADLDPAEKKVYLMECNGYTKIGISKDPERRRSQFQSGNPTPIRIVNVIETDVPNIVERILHEAFEDHKTATDREWFDLPESIQSELSKTDILIETEAREEYGPTSVPDLS